MTPVLTPFGYKELQSSTCVSSSLDEVVRILGALCSVSIFAKVLPNISAPNNPFHFQEKYQSDDLEILHFRNNLDSELVAVGLPEKIAPLIKSFYNPEQIIRTSGLWIRQGKKPLLLSYIETGSYPSLHPSHYVDAMNFVGLLGL